MGRNPRREQILVAEGAGIAGAARAALVRSAHGHAHPTRVTVRVVGAPAHPTKPAAVTVELFFVLIVIEATDGAEVGGAESDAATAADVGDRLPQGAFAALHCLHQLPVCKGGEHSLIVIANKLGRYRYCV